MKTSAIFGTLAVGLCAWMIVLLSPAGGAGQEVGPAHDKPPGVARTTADQDGQAALEAIEKI